ncbi:hypothetical protein [Methanococcoides seepicolus]|uniref:Uncharacterized protein n=1 Tax=Methanococcoides seepicolus TaxID=2828780 RepID=A0A9E4ZF59_9EURY|nr:hypothetical protein [Methanococcoides seepicolus]MCM1986961.1 hypothetical protein [Methanococcoides seepicolus]
MDRKIKIGIVVLALIILLLPYWFTFFIAGPPTPLFTVHNSDIVPRVVTVEIIGSDNSSIFSSTKELQPGSSWSQRKPFRMLSASLFDWAGISYVVHATLDNDASANLRINYHPWNTAYVSIGYGTIGIGEMTV